ncbi:hypothetical protein UPYG_G00196420 [Umbra pygmaea]|uniref:Zinc transporter 10 n=1 Tax=Umbra pygmaea TaxID=75934 RepID=A0ABD0WH97_UMBPY
MATSLGLLRGSSLHRCMLVLTVLLLLCQIVVSRVCSSLITMVDSFHTLFVLMHMAFSLPYSTLPRVPSKHPPDSPLYSPITSIHPPVQPSPTTQNICCVSNSTPCPSSPLPTPVPTPSSKCPSKPLTPPDSKTDSHKPCDPNHASSHSHTTLPVPATPPTKTTPPPASVCGQSYVEARAQPVVALLSALLLAALCVSVSLEILSHFLQPHPVQHPLLATMVAAVSLLYNLLVLGLSCGHLFGTKTEAGCESSDLRGERKDTTVKATVKTKGSNGIGGLNDSGNLPTCLDDTFQIGTLVFCNPGTSSVVNPDKDSELQTQTPQLPFDTTQGPLPEPCHESDTLPSDDRMSETTNSFPHRKPRGYHPKDPDIEGSKDKHTTPSVPQSHNTTAFSKPSACLQFLMVLTQAVLGSVLALTNGLTLLLLGPDCAHGSGICGPFVYLDPGFSVVAVVVLLATALPQVCRYSVMLLQASPPRVCVPDLHRRITSVPGVHSVHELHVWQLTESFLVASVHVHCHAELQIHRCGDLMSRVTRVLQSVGVNCCTVQPEFILSVPTTNGKLDNNNTMPTINNWELPSRLPCSMACGARCAGKMCCTLPEEECRGSTAPPAGETEEEPHMLIIENTFL